MSRYEDNLAGFYKFFAQALIRHGYTTKKRDGETFAFLKPFEYGHFIFSFSVHEDTGLIRVRPPQVSFDAVEKILQEIDYPDKLQFSISLGTFMGELSEAMDKHQKRMEASPTVESASLLGLETFRYIEQELESFEEEYSIPGNIIEELEYRDFWAMAFNGSPPEAMFRGLIFYQLASPELLPDKLHQSDQIFESRELVPDDAWRISYRVLKEKLPRWKAYSTDVSAHSFTVPSRFHSAFSLKAIWEYIKIYIGMR